MSKQLDDNNTVEFGKYFLKFYLNCAIQLSYCLRRYTDINLNIYLETLHTVINLWNEKKKHIRLAKIINGLILKKKMFEQLIKTCIHLLQYFQKNIL